MTRFATLTALAIAALLVPGAKAQEIDRNEIEAFVAQVRSCWSLPPADVGSRQTIKLRLSLAPDGSVTETAVVDPEKSEAGRRLAASAIRAVERCAPYSFSAETYEAWKTLEIDLQP